jgi:hypothetical protein
VIDVAEFTDVVGGGCTLCCLIKFDMVQSVSMARSKHSQSSLMILLSKRFVEVIPICLWLPSTDNEDDEDQ